MLMVEAGASVGGTGEGSCGGRGGGTSGEVCSCDSGGMVLLDMTVCLAVLGIMGIGLGAGVMELVVSASATVLVTCMLGGGVRGEVTCKETLF